MNRLFTALLWVDDHAVPVMAVAAVVSFIGLIWAVRYGA